MISSADGYPSGGDITGFSLKYSVKFGVKTESQGGRYAELASCASDYDDDIRRDVGRTFPYEALFAGEYAESPGQQALLRVLRATARRKPPRATCFGAELHCILHCILAEFRENPWYLVPMGTHRGEISRVFR